MGLNKTDAIRYDGTPHFRWVFLCKGCGAEIKAQAGYLLKHSGFCISCSHKTGDHMGAYGRLKYNTKTRGIMVELTPEEFVQLCTIPECHYCGTFINRGLKSGQKGYRGYFIDRKDNKKGYILDNCVPCCWACNQAKGDRYSYEEFLMITKNLKAFREESKIPHWSKEFSWSDGDEIPGYALISIPKN